MSTFFLWAAALLLVTLVFMLPPLMRKASPGRGSDEAAASLAVLRDHLRELDEDLERGLISADAYGIARAEQARRVVEEVGPGTAQAPLRTLRWSAPMVALLVPVGTAMLYVLLGSPDATVGNTAQVHAQQSMEHAVAGLARRLESSPEDIEGWHMLARSYNAM